MIKTLLKLALQKNISKLIRPIHNQNGAGALILAMVAIAIVGASTAVLPSLNKVSQVATRRARKGMVTLDILTQAAQIAYAADQNGQRDPLCVTPSATTQRTVNGNNYCFPDNVCVVNAKTGANWCIDISIANIVSDNQNSDNEGDLFTLTSSVQPSLFARTVHKSQKFLAKTSDLLSQLGRKYISRADSICYKYRVWASDNPGINPDHCTGHQSNLQCGPTPFLC